VGIEDVHVFKVHALEALVQAVKKIFARTPIAVRPGPSVPTSLGADNELIAMGGEIAVENAAKIFLCGARRRTVVLFARSKWVMPRSKARRSMAWTFPKESTAPKLCQRPSEMAGRSKPLRPQRRYCMVS
jgi:hypothetical protein